MRAQNGAAHLTFGTRFSSGFLKASLLLTTLALPDLASAACGTFEVSKGDVKVQSATTKAISPAPVGSKICSGDAVIAGRDSRAKLKMEDGNELNISPDSKIVLENYQFNAAENKKKVLLNILSGKVRATTKQENMYNDKAKDGQANTFQVRTKSAVAGVRGTDFLTSFDTRTQKSEVITFRGKVEFGQPGPGGTILNSVSVTAGQTTTVSIGQAPEPPRVVAPKQLETESKETKAETQPASGTKAPAVKEEGDKPSPKSESAAAPAPTGSATGAGATGRAPANIDKTPAAAPPVPNLPANSPPVSNIVLPPPLPAIPVIPTVPQAITDQIANGPAKVNVIIRVPTPPQ
jgi:hypothetical protein